MTTLVEMLEDESMTVTAVHLEQLLTFHNASSTPALLSPTILAISDSRKVLNTTVTRDKISVDIKLWPGNYLQLCLDDKSFIVDYSIIKSEVNSIENLMMSADISIADNTIVYAVTGIYGEASYTFMDAVNFDDFVDLGVVDENNVVDLFNSVKLFRYNRYTPYIVNLGLDKVVDMVMIGLKYNDDFNGLEALMFVWEKGQYCQIALAKPEVLIRNAAVH